MEESILNSTKKVLGLDASYSAFDLDILTYINSALSVVHQLGVIDAVTIDDDTIVWGDLGTPEEQTNVIKTYVYLRVRILFDPPATSFHKDAVESQLKEYEWRLSTMREYALEEEV